MVAQFIYVNFPTYLEDHLRAHKSGLLRNTTSFSEFRCKHPNCGKVPHRTTHESHISLLARAQNVHVDLLATITCPPIISRSSRRCSTTEEGSVSTCTRTAKSNMCARCLLIPPAPSACDPHCTSQPVPRWPGAASASLTAQSSSAICWCTLEKNPSSARTGYMAFKCPTVAHTQPHTCLQTREAGLMHTLVPCLRSVS